MDMKSIDIKNLLKSILKPKNRPTFLKNIEEYSFRSLKPNVSHPS